MRTGIAYPYALGLWLRWLSRSSRLRLQPASLFSYAGLWGLPNLAEVTASLKDLFELHEVVGLTFHDDLRILKESDADCFGVYCSSPLIKLALKVKF